MTEPRDEQGSDISGDGRPTPEPTIPTRRPYDACMLDVGEGHWVYVEEIGRADGIPALFLHGGPGSGSQHYHRALFDPDLDIAVYASQR